MFEAKSPGTTWTKPLSRFIDQVDTPKVYGVTGNVPVLDSTGRRLTWVVPSDAGLDHNPVTIGTGGFSTKLSVTEAQVLTIASIAHDELTDIGVNDHHSQVHVLAGEDHTASGLTIGHVVRATGATTFAWAPLQPETLSVSSINAAAASHTHAITTSSSPLETAAILATTAAGHLTLMSAEIVLLTVDTLTVTAIDGLGTINESWTINANATEGIDTHLIFEHAGGQAYIQWNGNLLTTSVAFKPVDVGINRISDAEPEAPFAGMVWLDP